MPSLLHLSLSTCLHWRFGLQPSEFASDTVVSRSVVKYKVAMYFIAFYCNILIIIDFPGILLHIYRQNSAAKYCPRIDFPPYLFNFADSGKPSGSQAQSQTDIPHYLEICWREESALADCTKNFLLRSLLCSSCQAEKGAQPKVTEIDCPVEDGRSLVLAEQKLPTLLHAASFLDIMSFLIT